MKDENEDLAYNVGSLVIFKNLSKQQKELFIKLISDDYSSLVQVLFNIIEDDNKVLQIVDIFAGQKIQFPSRKKLYKLLEKIKIYTYVKSKDYSSDACQLLAKQYKKRVSQIRATASRVDYLLDNGKFRDIQKQEGQISDKED